MNYKFSTLLAALCVAASADAGIYKGYKQSFSNVTNLSDAGWSFGANSASTVSDGQAFIAISGAGGNRGAVLNWGNEAFSSVEELAPGTDNNIVAFDFAVPSVGADRTGNQSITICTAGGPYNGSFAASNQNYIFELCDVPIGNVKSERNFYIRTPKYPNGLDYVAADEEAGTAAVYKTYNIREGVTYHLEVKIDVTNKVANWTIVSTTDAADSWSGSIAISDDDIVLPNALHIGMNRNNGSVMLDNIAVGKWVSTAVVETPTAAIVGLGTTLTGDLPYRIYNIEWAFEDGDVLNYQWTGEEGTLYQGDVDLPTSGKITAASATTDGHELTFLQSGKLTVWASNSEGESTKVEVDIDCTKLTVPQPSTTITGVEAGFAKTYTVNIDNSEIPTKPTMYFNYEFTNLDTKKVTTGGPLASGSKVSVDAAGTLVITGVASGFNNSAPLTVYNDTKFEVAYDFDFQHMTAEQITSYGFVDNGGLQTVDVNGTATTVIGPNYMRAEWYTGYGFGYYTAPLVDEVDEEGNPTGNKVAGTKSERVNINAASHDYLRVGSSFIGENVDSTIFSPIVNYHNVITEVCSYSGHSGVAEGQNLHILQGIGLITALQRGDEEIYDKTASYTAQNGDNAGHYAANNVTFYIDTAAAGLSASDFYVVYKVSNYGRDDSNSYGMASTVYTYDPESDEFKDKTAEEIAAWGLEQFNAQYPNKYFSVEVYPATESFTLYRYSDAITRVVLLKAGEVIASALPTTAADKVAPADNTIYNLQGQVVSPSALRPGIYIQNGKKFIVR